MTQSRKMIGPLEKRQQISGSQIVEFAMVFPVFAVLAFGTIDVGMLLYKQGVLDYATREGTRFAATEANTAWTTSGTVSAAARAVIDNFLFQFTRHTTTAVTVLFDPNEPRTFTVEATMPYQSFFGKLIPFLSNKTQQVSRITAYCEACG